VSANEPPFVCPLHGYTETSARSKLARHRGRGDTSVSMLWHDECGQWHVIDLEDYDDDGQPK
jgi:hypothetical protein